MEKKEKKIGKWKKTQQRKKKRKNIFFPPSVVVADARQRHEKKSKMTRPSVRRALADARELAGIDPSSPSDAATAAAVAYAAEHGVHALPATVPASTLVDDIDDNVDGDGKNKGKGKSKSKKADPYFVTPVAIALDRTGGHAAMREDILLPLDGKQREEKEAFFFFPSSIRFISTAVALAHKNKVKKNNNHSHRRGSF